MSRPVKPDADLYGISREARLSARLTADRLLSKSAGGGVVLTVIALAGEGYTDTCSFAFTRHGTDTAPLNVNVDEFLNAVTDAYLRTLKKVRKAIQKPPKNWKPSQERVCSGVP
jgi:hypothetical protein